MAGRGMVADGRVRESAVGEREVRWPVQGKPLPSRWMRYRIVDVFSDRPLAGNALCVVVDECPEGVCCVGGKQTRFPLCCLDQMAQVSSVKIAASRCRGSISTPSS